MKFLATPLDILWRVCHILSVPYVCVCVSQQGRPDINQPYTCERSDWLKNAAICTIELSRDRQLCEPSSLNSTAPFSA